ncbi:MAG: hypothetical protein BGO78_09860 [Chloroflexi bacterium 44-23]|nr:MAG: hypothetical protein BGO78_09860 [Chloroflexi bacterium 44-23]
MSIKNNSNRKVIASVQNALRILNLFENGVHELGNSEIAKRLNMDPGTVAGLIFTLKINKYLDQNPDNRKYRLGLKIAERAAVLLNQMDIRKTAAPFLEDLRDWSGESVNLAIRDNHEVVYIERMFGNHALGIRSEVGKRAPIHSTALGKAIIANFSAEELKSVLENYNFCALTPYTETDRGKFVQRLELIRTRGFAIDEQENELGGRCVGAPIFGHLGQPVAAISLSIPLHRFPEERIEEIGNRVKVAAMDISQALGFIDNSE